MSDAGFVEQGVDVAKAAKVLFHFGQIQRRVYRIPLLGQRLQCATHVQVHQRLQVCAGGWKVRRSALWPLCPAQAFLLQ